MRAKKAFFYSFALSFIFMGTALGVLWATVEINSLQAGSPANKIRVSSPGAEDSKTLLIKAEIGDLPQYYILKLNAIENRVGLLAISPRYKSLDHVAELEGMGRTRDILKNELGISIDYYICAGEKEMRTIAKSFDEVDISEIEAPIYFKALLVKNARCLDADSFINGVKRCAGLMDNSVGLEFCSAYTASLIGGNLTDNTAYAIDGISRCYRGLETDLNTNSLDRLKIIARFLSKGTAEVEYGFILADDENGKEKARKIFGR